VKEGFIDEERFARSFVHDKLNFNHWGRIKISCELRMKNIPPSICRDVIEDIDCPAYQSMLISVLEKKKKSTRGKDDREVFAKLLRFAAGRGFERSETLACLRRMFQTIDYVGDDTE
jgi:regulatory protein